MDFFESQDVARRNTMLLLVLFTLAVVSLIVLSNLLVFSIINFGDTARMESGAYRYDLKIFVTVSVGITMLIAGASLIRMVTLRKGGSAVAEMLDGKLLVDPGEDIHKIKLLNVVEEMAIASGTPVPPVYLIPDAAINAFAAGYSPGDAVIGVTAGASEQLSRDELQGVIAHEFSHILNGDMRMNIRLIGVLHGILVLTVIGRILARSATYRGGRRRGSNDGKIAAIGLGLLVIGYLGHFFGNIIKSAVSRQREYLADAASVQFTRNPSGIADALKRIGGYSRGTVMTHPESEELSHAFFCESETSYFAGIMSTHPPLDKRIARIQPDWDGKYIGGTESTEISRQPSHAAMGFAQGATYINAEEVVASIGNPNANQITAAKKIIGSLPEVLVAATRDPYSARALAYMMHLDDDMEIRDKQLALMKEKADEGVYEAMSRLIINIDRLTSSMRLPLLEMTLNSLRQLSYRQYKLFLANLDILIKADGRIGLSEWASQKMIKKHLGEAFEAQHTRVKFSSLNAVKTDIEVIISLLANAGRRSTTNPAEAFEAGRAGLEINISIIDKQHLTLSRMNHALDRLAALHPLRKPKLLKACIKTISSDNEISQLEQDLLRTIAAILECPMPPLTN